jgi:preprotein translocase subunit SecA
MAGRGTDIKLGQGVAAVGGLHILGTERHESRRIDRQLRGRSGRQGDPGSSRFSLSLEDDLMRLFGSERISGLMERMGVQEGEVIEHRLVTNAIGRAQKRVEAYNFDIRKHLLEYDDVMNQQRTLVYDLRNRALLSQDMSADALEAIREVVTGRVARYASERVHRDEWDLKGLASELSVVLMRPLAEPDLATDQFETLKDKGIAAAEAAYRGREAEFSPELMRELERHLFLFTLDEHWRDHLYELDHLKGGIGLRAYGQRDPLIEYKKEAFALFETLVNEVNEEFVERLFRVQLDPGATREIERRPTPRAMVAQHAETQTFGNIATTGGSGALTETGGAGTAVAAPVRSGPRVGRNDPCPCGSGKKYKKCHMLIDGGGNE